MKTSEAIDLLAGALAKAQAEMSNPPKNREVEVRTKTGGSYRFKYTTLDTVIDTIRDPLSKNGLAFLQSLQSTDGKLRLATRVMHSSGQWLETETPVMVSEDGMQALGSAQTYAKRYALSALFGLAADEDDDGNAGDGNTAKDASKGRTTPAKPRQDSPPPQATQTAEPPPSAPKADGRTKEQRAKAWVEESKALLAKMLVADEVDQYCQRNADRIESLGKNYPELDAEFNQAVRDAINSKPSNLEAA
jgi:hypothetical protein